MIANLGLGQDDLIRLNYSANQAQRLESKWERSIVGTMRDLSDDAIDELLITGKLPDLDLTDLLTDHSFNVVIEAQVIASHGEDLVPRPQQRLMRIPGSLEKTMQLYDQWKTGGYSPSRPRKQAMEIQRAYRKKVQDVWQKYSEEFRKGNAFTQEEVKRRIQEAAKTTISRAQVIVRTETTNYYNEGRKRFYDQSPDVTHYLFLAIRDPATSHWCTPKTINGKRGRHGLVYTKDDPLLEREKPACHWNCRSELLPLTPANANHLKLIENKSIQRRNVVCYPLPRNWAA